MKYIHIILYSACMMVSCSSSQPEQESMPVPSTVTEQQTQTAPTSNRTVSKGVIGSATDVTVYGELSEQVVEKLVNEGDIVKKGQTLFILNDENLRTQLILAENQMAQAEFQYEEILIGQGYKHNEFDQVPENIRNLALLKSGYNTQKESLAQARRQYEKRIVKAPVSGTVTELSVHKYDRAESGMALCHIIDTENLQVGFSILETELSRIAIGSKVKVTAIAYPEESHVATVTGISPVVSENGMVSLKAVIDGSQHLMPGMTAIVDL